MFILRIFWNFTEHRLRALWRIVIQFIMMGIFTLGSGLVLGIVYTLIQLVSSGEVSPDEIAANLNQTGVFGVIVTVFTLLATLFSMALVGHFVDRRRLGDFGFHLRDWGWWADLGFGLALGVVLMAGIFLVEWAAGWIQPQLALSLKPDYLLGLLIQLVLFLCVGIYEEVQFRGYPLRNLAEGINFRWLGPRGALVVAWLLTSMLFGAAHAGNQNATFISSFNIALAGIFLGLGYVLTGELAICIGLHITWNLFQGTVFGFPVSGGQFGASVFAIQQGGPDLWTGGAFGPEAGIIGILAMAAGCLLTLAWVWLRHRRLAIQPDLAEYTPRTQSAG